MEILQRETICRKEGKKQATLLSPCRCRLLDHPPLISSRVDTRQSE
jgi:hypothetical protein